MIGVHYGYLTVSDGERTMHVPEAVVMDGMAYCEDRDTWSRPKRRMEA